MTPVTPDRYARGRDKLAEVHGSAGEAIVDSSSERQHERLVRRHLARPQPAVGTSFPKAALSIRSTASLRQER
jgi:hypothetical protein